MASRSLLAIGCDDYEGMSSLAGAESDARAIFQLLIQPDIGEYCLSRSELLCSPTLAQVRDSLTKMLFDQGPIDTLTISFAGHGGISGGSFYMALRDSRANALSATALSLADLLRMIGEASPRQTYLVIDACQSGGVISDLNVILKSELMGKGGTPGITILATAASDQAALETGGQGVGTSALVSCINGNEFLQDSSATLDLIEIGRLVSERVSKVGGQTPVVWGLNLYGPAGFCKNPHAGVGDSPLRSILHGWQDASVASSVKINIKKLWGPYVSIETKWDVRHFYESLKPVLHDLHARPEMQVDLVRRICEACAAQCLHAEDRFREVEVRAVCAVSMLRYSDDIHVRGYLNESSLAVAALVESSVYSAIDAMRSYQYALLTGGMSDLYYLPIRISKILGWMGFSVILARTMSQDSEESSRILGELFRELFDNYPLSIVAMSDSQAPYVTSAVVAAFDSGLEDEAERLLSQLFLSVLDCKAQLSRGDLGADEVLDYLRARADVGGAVPAEMIARPTELVLALMRLARLSGLDEEFDLALCDLDHLDVFGYLPRGFQEFGEEHMDGGLNLVYKIGHDVWSVSDVEKAWPIQPVVEDRGVRMAALMACLIFPDRTPWFLLDKA